MNFGMKGRVIYKVICPKVIKWFQIVSILPGRVCGWLFLGSILNSIIHRGGYTVHRWPHGGRGQSLMTIEMHSICNCLTCGLCGDNQPQLQMSAICSSSTFAAVWPVEQQQRNREQAVAWLHFLHHPWHQGHHHWCNKFAKFSNVMGARGLFRGCLGQHLQHYLCGDHKVPYCGCWLIKFLNIAVSCS